MKKLLLLFISLISLHAHSHIRYSKDFLDINANVYTPDYDIRIGLSGGLKLTGSAPGRCFKIHVPSYVNEGYTSPSLYGNGAISFYYEAYGAKVWITCREIFTMSDERHKTDIRDMDSALSRILSAPAQRAIARSTSLSAKRTDAGLSYLKTIAPSAVVVADNDTLINYSEIIPVLFKAVQELSAESAQLDSDIESVKTFIQAKKGQQSRHGKIISCRPNPAVSDISVTYEIYSALNSPAISLINSSGLTVATIALADPDGSVDIAVDRFQPGIYYLVLTNGGAALDSHRIIKQ